MPPCLFVNPKSGSGEVSLDELAAAARLLGVDVHVLQPGDDLGALAGSVDATALGMAGGDGSLGAVAGAAADRDLPFVCIPYGTRNHFARDIGLEPDDPIAALAAFNGAERRIDLARAGGRAFVNNVALGAYAHLVHHRTHGRPFRRRSPLDIRVAGETIHARAFLVANNSYRFGLFSFGRRERLDAGELHLYAAEGLLPWRWAEWTDTRFELKIDSARVAAAIDGEPVELETPIEVVVEPLGLRLLQPGG